MNSVRHAMIFLVASSLVACTGELYSGAAEPTPNGDAGPGTGGGPGPTDPGGPTADAGFPAPEDPEPEDPEPEDPEPEDPEPEDPEPEDPEPEDPELVAFSEDEVQTLFNGRCGGCHGGSGGWTFSSIDILGDTVGVPSNQSALRYIEPGDHQSSYLYHKVAGSQTDVGGAGARMPLGGALSDDELTRFALFIDEL